MCGLYAQGANTSVGSEGAGTQLMTGPTSFTCSFKRLWRSTAQHGTWQ